MTSTAVAEPPTPPSPLPPSASWTPIPYAADDYWERRYVERVDEHTFEWYGSFKKVGDAVVAALTSTSLRLLHVGNGNSALPEQMWSLGYTQQLAADISPTVVARMAERTKQCIGLDWVVEDATKMPHADCAFDAVVDKGTYDALSTASGREQALVAEVRRVLRTDGVYVLISSLEATATALGPPFWREGEWEVSRTGVDTGLGGQCWVICAIKRLPQLAGGGEAHSRSKGPSGMAMMAAMATELSGSAARALDAVGDEPC